MSTAIMTDSHSGITKKEAEEKNIHILPMPFYIDGDIYYEDIDITREDFYNRLRDGVNVSTSQASPKDLCDAWDNLLKKYDNILYIPISSGLSGGYSTSCILAKEEKYAGRVFVVDAGRVSATMHRTVLDAIELTSKGYDVPAVRDILNSSRADMTMYVALSTVEYIKRGGRIKPSVAAVANILSIKPVMQFDVGVLGVHKKCRGMKKARKEMIDAMKIDFEGKFREPYENGDIYLLAATSSPNEETQSWISQIEDAFPGMPVMCDELSLGVSCHIGPDSLGIGCSVKARIPQ